MKLTLFVLLVTGIVSVRASPIVPLNETEWQLFKTQHGKTYENQNVEALRQTIFAVNKQIIDKFNEVEAESKGFTLGVNHLADLTDAERKVLNGFRLPRDFQSEREIFVNSPEAEKFLDDILSDETIEVPDELDWRKTPGRVSPVKSQGMCGSCWAFATTGVLEGQETTRTNVTADGSKLIALSEQNLVDCSDSTYGCGGGWMKDALNFVHREGGIDDEVSYPYKGTDGTCRFNKQKVVMGDKGAAILPPGDEEKLKQTVAKFGPVSVAIDASGSLFFPYRNGIYYDKNCGKKVRDLDHAVLVVGYGTDPEGGDYWLVKNSWGPEWGDQGYIKMARNRGNSCGIATVATIPTF